MSTIQQLLKSRDELVSDSHLFSVREQLKELTKEYDKSENDLKALQSVGQIVGEVLKQLTEDKCEWQPPGRHRLDECRAAASVGCGGGMSVERGVVQ